MPKKLLLILIILAIFSGCATNENDSAENSNIIQTEEPAEILEKNDDTTLSSTSNSPLSTPTQTITESPIATPTITPTSVPTPTAGKGTVIGNLAWLTEGNNSESAQAALLYLAPVINTDQGVQALVALDKETNQKTITNNNGHFIFDDIEPGTYGLVFSIPGVGEVLLKQSGIVDDLLITVTANEITDIEQIVSDFPLFTQ